ncbi:phytanoyl-CoA dioxygenase family protein [Luteipulveratus mongoliensis]|uniref:phytanoyl-CoA dioxygenase family protein n=1 Tax=Luteipulveratus mongoliensis TaxID=571913 RepID=UPI000B1508D6|nr:phytanoyl-CoA dioxygenase family protein [Luteipulveratus mongoliensis]
MVSDSVKRTFETDGYAVVSGLFADDEVDRLRDHYMRARRRDRLPEDMVGVQPSSKDPLKRYPRMAQMHRWDDTSLQWLLDARLRAQLQTLVGNDPYAVQTMLYFKPPGARGQALHQDNFYLKAEPGTCIAAWMALDATDEDNGCLLVVPGSHRWPISVRPRRTRRSASPT